MQPVNSIPRDWVPLAAFFLALGWLLPNHAQPWTTFHSDAWIATLSAVVAVAVLCRTLRQATWQWQWPTVWVLGVALIPLLQYLFGLLPFFGAAWMSFAYLLGLALALQIGSHWERSSPGQCGDLLFLAFGLAAIVSVGIQLYQWLQLDGLDDWISIRNAVRPPGNLGQPNQLASLLVIGTVSFYWGWIRKHLSGRVAVFGAGFMLLGLCLTGSRTGLLNAFVIALVLAVFHRNRSVSQLRISLALLIVLLLLLIQGLPALRNALHLDGALGLNSERSLTSVRLQMWALLAGALLLRPWFGFGWGQTTVAQLTTPRTTSRPEELYAQAHNIVLDLLLWNGIVVGAVLTIALVYWVVRCIRACNTNEHQAYLAAVIALLVHALFEYPLHYAYFLIPAGMIAGALTFRSGFAGHRLARSVGCCALALGALVLAVTVRDYFAVERSFYAFRFEKARIEMKTAGTPPDVLVLTHMRELIVFLRFQPQGGVDPQRLKWMRSIVLSYPSPYTIEKLEKTLVLNDGSKEAAEWNASKCRIYQLDSCPTVAP